MINPWTGKSKQHGQGSLNSILDQYFPQYAQKQSKAFEKEDEEVVKCMRRKYKPKNTIQQYRILFKLSQKVQKINEILEWLDQVDAVKKQQQMPAKKQVHPISSSFFYLPLHSSTVFHEILHDSLRKEKNKIFFESQFSELKKTLAQLQYLKTTNLTLQKEIL